MPKAKYNPWRLSDKMTKCRVYKIDWESEKRNKYYIGIGGYKGHHGKWTPRWSFGAFYDIKEEAIAIASLLNKMLINLQVHGAIKGYNHEE